MSSDRRANIRTALNAMVSVTHPTLGRRVYNTRDISDGGIFIVAEGGEALPRLGDRVEVQVQGLPVPAPILEMEVVRMTVDGFGLQFVNE